MKKRDLDDAASAVIAHEEPLFVLKYQKRRKVLYGLAFLFPLPMFYFIFFVSEPRSLGEIIAKWSSLYLAVIGVAFLADMLLFREIRVYSGKIVKEWWLMGTREMKFADVGLMSQHMPTVGVGAKCFFEQGMRPYRRLLMAIFHSMGITYKEHLADRNKVKQLNILLAELSGRRLEEIEHTGRLEKFLKVENL